MEKFDFMILAQADGITKAAQLAFERVEWHYAGFTKLIAGLKKPYAEMSNQEWFNKKQEISSKIGNLLHHYCTRFQSLVSEMTREVSSESRRVLEKHNPDYIRNCAKVHADKLQKLEETLNAAAAVLQQKEVDLGVLSFYLDYADAQRYTALYTRDRIVASQSIPHAYVLQPFNKDLISNWPSNQPGFGSSYPPVSEDYED